MRTPLRLVLALAAAAITASACGSSSSTTTGGLGGASSVTPTSASKSQAPFTLEDGFEHDVCGIGLIVRFIPSTTTSATDDEAVLEGGQISNVQDNVQDHTGQDPLPANAAKLDTDATATVLGKSFHVIGIDLAGSKIQLQPLC